MRILVICALVTLVLYLPATSGQGSQKKCDLRKHENPQRFWFMSNGKKVKSYACPKGKSFDQRACTCVIPHRGPRRRWKCNLREHINPERFWSVSRGKRVQSLPCAEGTVFDQHECTCVSPNKTCTLRRAGWRRFYQYDHGRRTLHTCPRKTRFDQTSCNCVWV